MGDEELRQFLIHILKNYKVYYLEMSGRYQEYLEEEELFKKREEAFKRIEDSRNIRNNEDYIFVNNYCTTETYNVEIPNINYQSIHFKNMKELRDILNIRPLRIKDDYSLEDIAKELSKVGDYEEFDSIYENSKLLELKYAMQKPLKERLNYLKENKKD